MWFELIWDRNPRTAPRIITEYFAKRKTVEFSKLADYLMKTKVRELIPKDEWQYYKAKDLDKVLLKPEDLDIRRIMFAYSHKVGHKIALAKIFNAAKREGQGNIKFIGKVSFGEQIERSKAAGMLNAGTQAGPKPAACLHFAVVGSAVVVGPNGGACSQVTLSHD